MKPLIPYLGSKMKEIETIKKYMPDNCKTMVDVFGGGGSVFLSLIDKFDSVHYNDLATSIYNLFVCYIDTEARSELMAELNKFDVTGFDKFDDMKSAIINGGYKYADTLELIAITKLTHLGCSKLLDKRKMRCEKMGQYINADEYFKTFDKLSEYVDVEITNDDFKKVLERYKDDESAFLYLDPPYVGGEVKQYKEYNKSAVFTLDDIDYIFEYMKTCKCKVLLNPDYTAYTREEVPEFYRFHYPKKYNANKNRGSKTYPAYHLILCNYIK